MEERGVDRRLLRLTIAIVAAVTLARIAVLAFSPLELYPDEAQYWWWAQAPDIGYFSKPPLIAWIIRFTTAVFGDQEWAIRLGMPLLHGAASLLLYSIGRSTFPKMPSVALFSALGYLTLPGVSYSSTLASTDAPLLFFWTLGLFAFIRAVQTRQWRWVILLGVAIGFGILAKYAMLFFPLSAALAAAFDPDVRKFVLGKRGLAAAAVAALIVAPNIAWNVAHQFATVGDMETNAEWAHAQFSVSHLAGFLAGQFGVFGPLLMTAWLASLSRMARTQTQAGVVLAAFSAPPLLIIAAQALIAEAHANWAATAYVAAMPLAIAEILERWPRLTLWISFALHGLVLALLSVVLVAPPVAEQLGLGNVFKRQEGWRTLAGAVEAKLGHGGYDVVASNNRSVTAELLYYLEPRSQAVRIWDRDLASRNQFEMTMRLSPPAPRVLLVLAPEDAAEVLPTFESTRFVERVAVSVGGGHVRVMNLYDARVYRGPKIRA